MKRREDIISSNIWVFLFCVGYNKTVIINICVAKARLFYYNTDKDKEY